MENKRPLVLIPQSCCPEPDPGDWVVAFQQAGRPLDKICADSGDEISTTSVIALTAIEGQASRSFVSTGLQDSRFLTNLYCTQMAMENNPFDAPCDIVVVICHPPAEAIDSAMPIVVQLTAAGHRIHTLMPDCVSPKDRHLARQMAAAGIWHHYSHDRDPREIQGLKKAIGAIEEFHSN